MNSYPEAFFTQLETLHLHIDGTASSTHLERMINSLRVQGFPSKMHKVLGFIEGPQRTNPEFKQTYAVHTTGFGDEKFGHFSTTLLKERKSLRDIVQFILSEFASQKGNVLEIEQVIGKIKCGKTEWSKINPTPLSKNELGIEPTVTYPIEIHHAINIQAEKGETKPPVDLRQSLLELSDLDLGGIFVFKDADIWKIRTNSFSKKEGIQRKVEKEHDIIKNTFPIEGYREAQFKTLVESVLAVVKI